MKQTLSLKQKYFFALLSFLIMPISGIAIDIYVPSLPAISTAFKISNEFAQLTITSYTLGLGAMQLVAGSISDSYGRRYPYLIAMLIFICATFFIPLAHNINQLLFLRLIQGSSIAFTVVPVRSIISDLFEGRELKKMLIYATLAWSIGPIIAPAIGGYLQHYFGWKASFYFLASYSFILFCITLIHLPETTILKHSFHLTHTVKRYINIIANITFTSGIIINGLLYSLVILFSVIGPFYIQNTLHYSAITYGNISLLLGFCWFLGAILSRALIDQPFKMKIQVGLWCGFIAALCLLISTQYLYLNILLIAIIFICGGMIFPNFFARSINLYREASAGAGAIFSSFVFLIASLSSYAAVWLPANTHSLALAYIIIIVINLAVFYYDKHR